MHDFSNKIITDNDFADMYCLNNGRTSVLPARLTKILILQNYENLSDREPLEMVRLNIAWKYALNVPIGYEGFDRSLLVYFRARLQALFTAAGVNLKNIIPEQGEKCLILDIVGANAVNI